jgi:GAG-pre-integrase domain/Integrase core domain
MSLNNTHHFPALSPLNWHLWSVRMRAYLSALGLWEYVDDSKPKPVPRDVANPTPMEKADMANWKRKMAKASGEIWLALEDDQKAYVRVVKSDPTLMWKTLECLHLPKPLNPNPSQYSDAVEFAGHACALSASGRTQWLKSRACNDWNTDTGATSHMTPHRHWFHTYSPHVIPIRLANNSEILSAGLGSVEFQPTIDGKPGVPIIFTDVLHVPDLGSNLLSLFHLTQRKGYKIVMESNKVQFQHRNEVHFTATVTCHNVGYLDGYAIVLKPQAARVASTCPLDLSLWHRRCSHVNFTDLEHMYKKKLVDGMVIKSKSQPDPICEPCIMGKQHRHNIPKTASRKTAVLELVYTDLKGPLPVQSMEGYRYWQLFVDDKSRFTVVAFLKQKSDALVTFKRFKAFAEKKTGKPVLMTRDDKGGEFIGKEYNDFCADEGIQRQHTEPNEPHQNGVPERGNRCQVINISPQG